MRLIVVLLLFIGAFASVGLVAGAEETTYFEERFENASLGSSVYQTDFESGTDDWQGWTYIYIGSKAESTVRLIDSVFRTTVRGSVDSSWNNYHIYQQHHIEIDRSGTYHLYLRADAGFPERQFDDSINFDRFQVDGNERSIESGRETHYRLNLDAGNHSFKRTTQFSDTDGGRVNGSTTIDQLSILRDSSDRFRNWESTEFPMYTASGIEGTSLYLRSASATINASPAQHKDPVVVAFDLRTSGEEANWSIEQSGYTIADGVIEAHHSRTIKRTVSFQTGTFTLDIDSSDTVAVDNLRVIGYQDAQTSHDQLQPGVAIIDQAAPSYGYDMLLGGLDGILTLGLDTATYLSLAGLAVGSVLFIVGRRRNDRGLVLVVGASTLLVSVLIFGPMLDTVAWIVAGHTDQPSLSDPDLSATSLLYRDDFDGGSLSNSQWNQISGRPSDAYLETGSENRSRLVLRDGAVVETTVPLDGVGIEDGIVTIETSVWSNVGQAPPDEDALSIEVVSGGSTVLDEPEAVLATGGDTVGTSLQRNTPLPGRTVTIRLGASDTNGGDGRARVDVSRVLLRGAP